MTRSRLAAAALSAAALGLAAVLVPTASLAEPVTETPAASEQVTWADAANEFTPFAPTGIDDFTIADEWQWTAIDSETSDSLADYGTFGDTGFTANGSSPVILVHGVPAPVSGSEFAAFVEDASTNAGPEAQVGLLVVNAESEIPIPRTVFAVDGLHGLATQWFWQDAEPLSTEQLAGALSDSNVGIFGYFVMFPGNAPVVTSPPVDPENPPVRLQQESNPFEDAPTVDEALAEQGGTVALRAAAVPEAAGIASYRIGDLTTYFTPQPDAALALSTASITVAQATTTGFTISGSGFAPGEIVSTGIGTGAMGDSLPDTFVADADGNVSGTIVLPAAWATAGDYFIVLVGESSGQVASSALAITGAAPVAVPVPGEATYTG